MTLLFLLVACADTSPAHLDDTADTSSVYDTGDTDTVEYVQADCAQFNEDYYGCVEEPSCGAAGLRWMEVDIPQIEVAEATAVVQETHDLSGEDNTSTVEEISVTWRWSSGTEYLPSPGQDLDGSDGFQINNVIRTFSFWLSGTDAGGNPSYTELTRQEQGTLYWFDDAGNMEFRRDTTISWDASFSENSYDYQFNRSLSLAYDAVSHYVQSGHLETIDPIQDDLMEVAMAFWSCESMDDLQATCEEMTEAERYVAQDICY